MSMYVLCAWVFCMFCYSTTRTSIMSVARTMSMSMSTVKNTTRTTGSNYRPSSSSRLIVDTDVGFDDIVAICCLLKHDVKIDMVTTTCGMSKSNTGAQAVRMLFPDIFKVLASPDQTTRNEPPWIAGFRTRLQTFLNETTQSTNNANENENNDQQSNAIIITEQTKQSTTDAVLDLLVKSENHSVDIICLGPLSNIASWLQADEELFTAKLGSLWIAGGNHPSSGATSQEEFNFASDPDAAHAVLHNPSLREKIILVPPEETSYKQVSASFVEDIVSSCSKQQHQQQCSSADICRSVIQADPHYSMFYDPICCFLYLNPSEATFVPTRLSVDKETGLLKHASGASDEFSLVQHHRMASSVQFDAYKDWLLSGMSSS